MSERIYSLHDQGCSIRQIADQLGTSKSTVQRVLSQRPSVSPSGSERDEVLGEYASILEPLKARGLRGELDDDKIAYLADVETTLAENGYGIHQMAVMYRIANASKAKRDAIRK